MYELRAAKRTVGYACHDMTPSVREAGRSPTLQVQQDPAIRFASELLAEPIRRNVHSFTKVEAMRVGTLHAGVELEHVAVVRAREAGQPIEQPPAVSLRSGGLIGNEVVDVDKLAAEEGLR